MNRPLDREPELLDELQEGLLALDIATTPTQLQSMLRFLDLLKRWNRVQKLTSISEPGEMIRRHLLDSAAVSPWLLGDRILDVGSGAGLPGIPLAILLPQRHFYLLDSLAKRCRFLFQVVTELALDNVDVVQQRVEEHVAVPRYDTVISRAFASLPDFLEKAGRLCAADGRILAMKGRYPQEEIDAVQMPYNVRACHRLRIPGLGAERHLLLIERKDPPGDRDDP